MAFSESRISQVPGKHHSNYNIEDEKNTYFHPIPKTDHSVMFSGEVGRKTERIQDELKETRVFQMNSMVSDTALYLTAVTETG